MMEQSVEAMQAAAAQGVSMTDVRVTEELDRLANPELYVNRELSWLDFNDRVLQLAQDESLPLIERLQVPGDLRDEPR